MFTKLYVYFIFRYAISDLYKPHHSRVRSARRSSSPTHARPHTPEPERGAARRRAPIDEVNFGEAAKKSRQQSSFGGAERRTNTPRQRYSQPTRCFIYSTFPFSASPYPFFIFISSSFFSSPFSSDPFTSAFSSSSFSSSHPLFLLLFLILLLLRVFPSSGVAGMGLYFSLPLRHVRYVLHC